MKNIYVLALLFCSLMSVYGQSDAGEKLTKAEKKELKNQEAKDKAEAIDWMVNNHRFVLQASELRFYSGKTMDVSNVINFFAIDSSRAVFQLASAHNIGANGIGGKTIKGNVTSYKLSQSKNKQFYYIIINMNTSNGQFEILCDINLTGGAKGKINDHTSSNITLVGELVHLSETNMAEGISD